MLISNLLSKRSGREVPNQFVMEDDNKVVFQSYRSVCAIYYRSSKLFVLGEDWNYSNTTRRYLHQFLNEYVPERYNVDTQGMRKLIKAGVVLVLSNKEISKM